MGAEASLQPGRIFTTVMCFICCAEEDQDVAYVNGNLEGVKFLVRLIGANNGDLFSGHADRPECLLHALKR